MAVREFIWGCVLSEANAEYEWNAGGSHSNIGGEDELSFNLLLKQAVLGVNAVEKELNIVELQSTDFYGDNVRQPLIRLTCGKSEQCSLDILLTQSCSKLRLIKGSGPVHIWGQLIIDIAQDEDDLEESRQTSNSLEADDELSHLDGKNESKTKSDQDDMEEETEDEEELEISPPKTAKGKRKSREDKIKSKKTKTGYSPHKMVIAPPTKTKEMELEIISKSPENTSKKRKKFGKKKSPLK